MRQIIICLLTLFTFSGTAAFAGSGGGGHSHAPAKPVSEAQALEKATSLVKGFVLKEKIDASWAEVVPTVGIKKQMKSGEEWVITFDNPKVEDKAKQALYVFLSLSGDYLAANYSGK